MTLTQLIGINAFFIDLNKGDDVIVRLKLHRIVRASQHNANLGKELSALIFSNFSHLMKLFLKYFWFNKNVHK